MKAIFFVLVSYLSFARSLSSMRSDLLGNCLNCINSGLDFCSTGNTYDPVDPINGVCCQNMASAPDTCYTGYNACTWRTTTTNRFNKFFSCRKNTKCLV